MTSYYTRKIQYIMLTMQCAFIGLLVHDQPSVHLENKSNRMSFIWFSENQQKNTFPRASTASTCCSGLWLRSSGTHSPSSGSCNIANKYSLPTVIHVTILENLLCALSNADFPRPAVPAFGPCRLNIGAFFSMSGSMRKRIFEPRI